MSNNNPPFLIAPSEAVLLGICLEDYLVAAPHNPDGVSFIRILHTRLRPLTPEMRQVREKVVDEASVPNDVQWATPGDCTIGIRPSCPNIGYLREYGKYTQFWFDVSRRSLPQLIVQFLDGCVGKSPYDQVNYPADTRMPNLLDWARMLSVMESLDAAAIRQHSAPSSPDDYQEVEKRLALLVQSNGRTVGRRFSTLAVFSLGCSVVATTLST